MPEKRREAPLVDRMTVVFIVLAIASGTALWWLQGADTVAKALSEGVGLLLMVLPVVVLAVLVAAYVQWLLPVSMVERWLGGGSGMRGFALATVGGALPPGGPFAAFPLVLGLHRAGASLPVCIAYLTSWSVLGLQRVLMWELPFFGAEFSFLRLLVSVPLPLIAGLVTKFLLMRAEIRI